MSSVHEPQDISVTYQDNNSCYPHFKQLVSSLFPLNEIKFQFDIGEFSMKKFRPAFYQINDPYLNDIDNPLKTYKRPYVYIYFVTFSSVQDYMSSVRSQLESFISKHEKKGERDERDEWLIIYTTNRPIMSEVEYKSHVDNFNQLELDFAHYNQSQDYQRVISMFGFDPKVEIHNVSFEGLYKFSVSFVGALQNGVQQRVEVLEDQMTTMLESKDNESWNFLKFFTLKENIAIIYENLKMPLEAFQKYEELRNKYYEFILRKADKLKFIKEEFYLIKGKENPYLLDIDREKFRSKIFDNTISEFDFVQYLFARQAELLKLMNWYHEGIERVKLFISDIFHRATRELPPVQDQDRFTIFKHIWSIQALHGFLEFYNPKTFVNENPHAQADLKVIRINFKHHAILHLEQLYSFLYGSSIDKVKVKSFTEEFEKLLDILEHGGAQSKIEEAKTPVDLSHFHISDPKLKEVFPNKDAFLEYIFEEKVKYTQSSISAGCKKIGLFKAIEYLKYRIEQHKIEPIKMEEVTTMIQTYDKNRFYDVSDVLRIFLLRIQLQKRNFSEITAPFLKIYKHQKAIIKRDFEDKDRNPFEILNTFCQRNIGKSFKAGKVENFKLKSLSVDFDDEKNVMLVDYSADNEFGFPISKCKLQLIIKPADLKKGDDKSHKKKYEKYSWHVENLGPGEFTNQAELKGKNSGIYKVKAFFLKISKFRFKVVLPPKVNTTEFTIQGEKRFSYNVHHKTIEGLMYENKLPTDNELPLILKLSNFSFRFDKMKLELRFTSNYTVFLEGNQFFSVGEKDAMLQDEVLAENSDPNGNRAFDLRPSADAKTLYLLLKLKCISQNHEVYDTLHLKASFYLKSSHVFSNDQSFSFHFSPLMTISPRFYRLPDKSFLHFDIFNICLFPLKIISLETATEKDLIDSETQIEPSEEFSALIDDPKEKNASLLTSKVSVIDPNETFLKEALEGLPEFVKNKVQVSLDFVVEYDFKFYLEQAEPHYKVEIDFPKAALYQQSYIMNVKVSLLPGTEVKECNIAIEDKLNNWLSFGKTKYYIALEPEKAASIQFNIIPIKVGEVPLPKVCVSQKKLERKKEKMGKKPMLMINVQEVNNEPDVLPEEKLEIRFTNSQMIQVFNNSTISSESFSLI